MSDETKTEIPTDVELPDPTNSVETEDVEGIEEISYE